MNKLTVAEWAASLGMSKQAGYQAVKRCGIPVIDSAVDPEIATVLYRRGTRVRAGAKRQDPSATERPAASIVAPPIAVGQISYDEARRRREVAEASIAELKEAELRGDLVRRAVVEREFASRLVALRESLEVLADRLSAQVAAEADAGRCRQLLRDDHRLALAAFVERIDLDAATEESQEDDDGLARA